MKNSKIKVYGTGIMLWIYELGGADQFNEFLKASEDGELDYDDP